MSRSVLVVDDAAFMRMMLRDILSGAGYTVHEAVDAADAVAKYGIVHPDLVTMDITLPGMDGIEAIRAIRSADPSARVMVVSAHGEARVVQEALDAGAVGYLVKPFQPDKVVELVRACIGAAPPGPRQPRL
jgi:two-component system chemotaxis response regulator CheY